MEIRQETTMGEPSWLGKFISGKLNKLADFIGGYGDFPEREAAPLQIGERDMDGNTALHLAIQCRQPEAAKELVERGADINARNHKGNTPLILAGLYSAKETVETLLKRRADINAKNDSGFTALHYAANFGRIETVKLLAERGADINATEKRGGTPLMDAACHGHAEAVKCLLEHGADASVPDDYGKTASDYADGIGDESRRDEILTLLREANHAQVREQIQILETTCRAGR